MVEVKEPQHGPVATRRHVVRRKRSFLSRTPCSGKLESSWDSL